MTNAKSNINKFLEKKAPIKRNNSNHPWKAPFSKKQREKENEIKQELKKTPYYEDLWPRK